MTHKSNAHRTNAPLAIADNHWWVGSRRAGEILHSNVYLRQFPAATRSNDPFHLLIDPVAAGDLDIPCANLERLIGGVEEIDALWLSHQDPAASSRVAKLLRGPLPDVPVLCTEDTGELLHNYCAIREGQFVHLEDYPQGLRLPTGDVIIPIAAPFCHFKGASMLYDPCHRVLYSGDLFAGLTRPERKGRFADASDWAGVRAFHQLYMPTQSAVQDAIDAIRALDPPVEVIAPQHGGIIKGATVNAWMNRLYELPVGVDIVQPQLEDADRSADWTHLLNDLMRWTTPVIGGALARRLLADDDWLGAHLQMGAKRLAVQSRGRQVVERAVRLWADEMIRSTANALRFEAVYGAAQHELPTPRIDLGEETVFCSRERDQNPTPLEFPAPKARQ